MTHGMNQTVQITATLPVSYTPDVVVHGGGASGIAEASALELVTAGNVKFDGEA